MSAEQAVAASMLEWTDNGHGGVILTGSPFLVVGITGTTLDDVVETITVYEPWQMLRMIGASVCEGRRMAYLVDTRNGSMLDIEVFGDDLFTIRLYAWCGRCQPETVIRFARTARDLYGDGVQLQTGQGEVVRHD